MDLTKGMSFTKGSKSLLWLGAICGLHLLMMLMFRGLWYGDLPIGAGDPYGVADIIELLLVLVFLLLLLLAVIVALVLIFRGLPQTRKTAFALIVWCVLLLIAREPLRHLVAVWAA